MEADGLFVYGTLRRGGSNRAWLERTHPEGTCRAWVPGRLWHLPDDGYPAMVLGPEPATPPPGEGWVTGDFVGWEDLEDLEAALPDLDALEDVAGGLYLRRLVDCVLESGHRLTAWVYVFPEDRLGALERHGVEMSDGDWEAFLG